MDENFASGGECEIFQRATLSMDIRAKRETVYKSFQIRSFECGSSKHMIDSSDFIIFYLNVLSYQSGNRRSGAIIAYQYAQEMAKCVEI